MFGLGLDIGGTKCAAVIGCYENGACRVLEKETIDTASYLTPDALLAELYRRANHLLLRTGLAKESLCGVGISCGGPLDPQRGLILSPPNLPGWDRVPIVEKTAACFSLPVFLANDADASALAEWKFGAGQGCRNMIFLTFGTGMGAGLILNGSLYTGACGMAGEVGHVRLGEDGPEGYGKNGSFEGFCSGGGLAKSAVYYAQAMREKGMDSPLLEKTPTAREIACAAEKGDPYALFLLKNCAHRLGEGLSILIDLLNPEKIVIGSIYARNRTFFERETLPVVRREALSRSLNACEILPAALGEAIGDFASLSVIFAREGKQ